MGKTRFRLGLIGDNIRASRAPDLHRLAGRMAGLEVSYELFIPPALGMSFGEVFDHVEEIGLDGVNVTLPYKERVVSRLRIDDAHIARIGACNTVRFDTDGPRGFNTDFSAFVTAYGAAFPDLPPGRVVMFGAGGVGKAVAFALKRLKAERIVFIDPDRAKAEALADVLNADGTELARVGDLSDLPGADGVINCTPLGMVGYGGSPVAQGGFPGCRWAFDAVYTPVDTPFRAQAEAAGARFISGYELYYYQGVDAFEIFTGQRVTDHARLRAALAAGPAPLSA